MAKKKKNSSKFHSPQLDIIKALAIVFVIACHYFPGPLDWHLKTMPAGWFEDYWKQPSADWLHFVESYLYLGVNLFVIASGFGLFLSHLKHGKKIDLKDFFIKRVWRLMPAAIFSIILLFFVKGFFLGSWPTQNFYVNIFPFLGGLNLFSDQWFFPPINGETWFLGLIIQLYLFFPLLVWLYEKLDEKKFLILLFAVSVIFRIFYYIFWKDAVTTLSYGLSIGRLFEFGFGMVLAKQFIHGKKLNPWWIVGLAGCLGYFWWWSFPFADALAGVGLFTLLWYAAAGFPQWKIWGRLALSSYFIFLLHHPFIWILDKWFTDKWSLAGVGVFILFVVFSYLLAEISQRVLDLVNGLFRQRKKA